MADATSRAVVKMVAMLGWAGTEVSCLKRPLSTASCMHAAATQVGPQEITKTDEDVKWDLLSAAAACL